MVRLVIPVLGLVLGPSVGLAHAQARADEVAGSEPGEVEATEAPARDEATATTADGGTAEAPASEPSATEAPASEPSATEASASDRAPAEAAASPAEGSAGDQPPASTTRPATTPAAEPTPPEPAATTSQERPPRTYPRLVIAGGPVVGPHAFGNEQCDAEQARCETKGSFLGLGGQLELRGRLWRMIYAHARGVIVGNVSPNDRVYRGAGAIGVGLGLQGRRAFGRAEYLHVRAFGDNHFEPPFYDGEVAVDEWGHHAGLLSVGFRQPLPKGLSAELWGGLMMGPRSVRRVPQLQPDERVLSTFLVGLNLSWDAWP